MAIFDEFTPGNIFTWPIITHEDEEAVLEVLRRGGMSGIELARVVTSSDGAKAPVIIITAHDDSNTRSEALAAGCAAYFRKNDPGSHVLASTVFGG